MTGYPSAYISIPTRLILMRYFIPALKWFNADGKDEPYEAGRDLDSLAAL